MYKDPLQPAMDSGTLSPQLRVEATYLWQQDSIYLLSQSTGLNVQEEYTIKVKESSSI